MWETVRIFEICDRITSGGTPNSKMSEYYSGGKIPWLKTKEVQNRRVYSTETYITESGLNNSSAKLIPEDSVIIAMYGDGNTAGKVAINKIPVTTNQACCNLILNKERADYEFVFYNLLGRYDELVGLKTGSGQQNLNLATIKNMSITIPDLSIQKKISRILSQYDLKSSKNDELILLLSELCQQIYQNWFNDFNYPNATEELVLSDKLNRYIPSNWEVKQFKDFLIPCTEKIGNIDAPIYSTTNNGIALREEKFNKNLTKSQSSNKKIVKGDIIFGLSREILNFGVFMDQIGSVSPAYQIFKIDKSVILPFMLDLEIRINMPRYMDILQLGAREGQGIRKDYLMDKYFLVPKMDLQREFSEIYSIFQRKIAKLKEENSILLEIRDTLLPKFMNGELPVEVGNV